MGYKLKKTSMLQNVPRAGVGQSVQWLIDWMTRVRFSARAKDFSSSLCVQTGSGAHPTYPVSTGGPFPRGRPWLGCDADHSPPSRAEV
jgi:hypothetical protein